MYKDDQTWPPFLIMEHDAGGTYSLLLYDSKMLSTEQVFVDQGRGPGGYSWADLALHAATVEEPKLTGRFRLDPEAGMFCAYGDDLAALEALAARLHRAYHDHALLAAWLKVAPWEYD